MAEISMLAEWIQSQRPKGSSVADQPVFYRNLEEALDIRRKHHTFYTLKTSLWKNSDAVDFSSNDTLSLNSSGRLRAEFMKELSRHPDLPLGSTGSRIMDGNSDYVETVEKEIAAFHRAETGLLMGSGFDANMAVFAAVPRPGDVIVYDELVHASMHDGMLHSQVLTKLPFRHNDIESFQEVLETVSEQPLIAQGKRCVIIAIESVYSMDGDICPLKDLVSIAKNVLPTGTAQFFIDEAHSTGVLGPEGAGLVNELGLENEIAIRVHTFGKAMGSSGAIILGNQTLKAAITNLARAFIYTTAPPVPTIATIRAAYNLLHTEEVHASQERVQTLVKYFFSKTNDNPILEDAFDRGIISIPLADDWENEPFHSHIVPVRTRDNYSYYLMLHLQLNKFCAFPVEYPTVPKGQGRVRLAFHAENREEQIDRLIQTICEWVGEMKKIEDGESGGEKVPSAARLVYSWMGGSSGKP